MIVYVPFQGEVKHCSKAMLLRHLFNKKSYKTRYKYAYQLEIEMDRYAYKYMEVRICQLCHMEVESKQYPHHLSHQQIKSIITWHQKVHSLL